jgi:hypothetical protein
VIGYSDRCTFAARINNKQEKNGGNPSTPLDNKVKDHGKL